MNGILVTEWAWGAIDSPPGFDVYNPVGVAWLASDSNPSLYGPLGSAQPTPPFPASAHAGVVVPHYYDADLKDKIILSTQRINLGNLVSSQTRDVYLWNTYRTTETILDLTGDGLNGIHLKSGPTAPFEIDGFKEAHYEVVVGTVGPPKIAGTYTWTHDTWVLVLYVIGTRVVLFPWPPLRGMLESLEWRSHVLESYDGHDYIQATRSKPRGEYEWNLMVQAGHARRFNAQMRGRHTRPFCVPHWHEARKTEVEIAEGAGTITTDTTFSDYREGGLVVLWTSPTKYEIVEVDTFTDTMITLANPVINPWPVGTTIMPGQVMQAAPTYTVGDYPVDLRSVVVRWESLDDALLASYDWPIQYQGRDVVTGYLLSGDTVGRDFAAPQIKIDYGTGVVLHEYRYHANRAGTPDMRFHFSTREQAWNFRRWLHKVRGKQTPFWISTMTPDIEITQPFGAETTSLTIKNIGYTLLLNAGDTCKHLCFRTTAGVTYCRQIVNATEVDDNEENLILDTPFGFIGGPDSFSTISFLYHVRLDADRIEWVWNAPTESEIILPVRETIEA
ncbi:MAG: hypothetical protein WC145_11750 [Aliarcobacter sp.]